ncbi:MAG: carbohydrate kinase family protein [Oscillospiraceae bacterium]|nr:carbohydrate kinase family protein [Oscillospiraceae bacterium]
MNSPEKTGIALCGNVLVDLINHIRAYPAPGELTKIVGLSKSVGGCVPNVGIDLKKICPSLKVSAIAKIGKDDNGAYAKEILTKAGLDLAGLREVDTPTSFTQVMSIEGGQRTFFTYAGADGQLTAEDVDLSKDAPKILHLGYFLLLDKIDQGEGLKLLQKATEAGVETSIDLVSENSDRYSLVLPCLPYTDYLIINELEAGKLTGTEPNPETLPLIAMKLKELGVRKKVIIHMPDRAICCSNAGLTAVPSYDLPGSAVVGTTGAGDAFCAGALYGIYEGWEDRQILEFASGAAVMALSSADATSGLVTEAEIRDHCKQYRRKQLCL